MSNSSTVKNSLKHTVAKGFLWASMSNIVCQLFTLLFGIYLARILGPDDYGPIGMLAIFSAIAGSLQDSGFVVALANRKEVTNDDYNAVFWFNILISLLMYALLYVCAPFIASFFNQPILVGLSRYNFLGFVVAGFGIAPSAYLFRELKVKQKSIALILSIVISGIVGVALALKGYSYWGIATQSITYVLVRTVVCWYFTPWRPSFKVNFAPLRYLFAFSYRILITNIFQRFNWNIFSFILGKFYTRTDVGNYTKSAEWFNMGSEVVNGMVNAVAQPVLAKVVDDCERQLRVFRKIKKIVVLVHCPILLNPRQYRMMYAQQFLDTFKGYDVMILAGHSHADSSIRRTYNGKEMIQNVHASTSGTFWYTPWSCDGTPGGSVAYHFGGERISRDYVGWGEAKGKKYLAYDNVDNKWNYRISKFTGDGITHYHDLIKSHVKNEAAVLVNVFGAYECKFTESTGGTGRATNKVYDLNFRDWHWAEFEKNMNGEAPEGHRVQNASHQRPRKGAPHTWRYIPADPTAVITVEAKDVFGNVIAEFEVKAK